ncbi:MAG TPA: hypothetical protein VFX70_12175, partial [Mycobacteriales bacterium]|nr:hypothetical protein [Mycobacteriales bacterium]
GGMAWGSTCVLLGYAFAASLRTVQHYLAWGPVPVVVLVVGGLVALDVRRRRRERALAREGRSSETETV